MSRPKVLICIVIDLFSEAIARSGSGDGSTIAFRPMSLGGTSMAISGPGDVHRSASKDQKMFGMRSFPPVVLWGLPLLVAGCMLFGAHMSQSQRVASEIFEENKAPSHVPSVRYLTVKLVPSPAQPVRKCIFYMKCSGADPDTVITEPEVAGQCIYVLPLLKQYQGCQISAKALGEFDDVECQAVVLPYVIQLEREDSGPMNDLRRVAASRDSNMVTVAFTPKAPKRIERCTFHLECPSQPNVPPTTELPNEDGQCVYEFPYEDYAECTINATAFGEFDNIGSKASPLHQILILKQILAKEEL
eukprot:maker-scaffold1018_size70622-snap-gene-0.13 protein:Tk00800 transcript:maker-scaffold1018_size70622-snap-gene-0.13-mRNA-1 annotation:"family transcriptional regulator"